MRVAQPRDCKKKRHVQPDGEMEIVDATMPLYCYREQHFLDNRKPGEYSSGGNEGFDRKATEFEDYVSPPLKEKKEGKNLSILSK